MSRKSVRRKFRARIEEFDNGQQSGDKLQEGGFEKRDKNLFFTPELQVDSSFRDPRGFGDIRHSGERSLLTIKMTGYVQQSRASRV
jgi:hypothetical protein